MYDNITKDYLKTHLFNSDGLSFSEEHSAFRLRADDPQITRCDERQIELRVEISRLISEKYGKNKEKFEAECNISWVLKRKWMNGDRKITRDALAKLCVGMSLDIQIAEKLFRYEGHSLEPDLNKLDAVVVDALKCGDDIYALYDTCEAVGLALFRER